MLTHNLWSNSDINEMVTLYLKVHGIGRESIKVGDLYNENKLYNVEEFCLKYDIQVNILEYMGIV